ncbi:unnamed protein product [Chrysoparadoxa australica]
MAQGAPSRKRFWDGLVNEVEELYGAPSTAKRRVLVPTWPGMLPGEYSLARQWCVEGLQEGGTDTPSRLTQPAGETLYCKIGHGNEAERQLQVVYVRKGDPAGRLSACGSDVIREAKERQHKPENKEAARKASFEGEERAAPELLHEVLATPNPKGPHNDDVCRAASEGSMVLQLGTPGMLATPHTEQVDTPAEGWSGQTQVTPGFLMEQTLNASLNASMFARELNMSLSGSQPDGAAATEATTPCLQLITSSCAKALASAPSNEAGESWSSKPVNLASQGIALAPASDALEATLRQCDPGSWRGMTLQLATEVLQQEKVLMRGCCGQGRRTGESMGLATAGLPKLVTELLESSKSKDHEQPAGT